MTDSSDLILVGVGANLPTEAWGPPRATCGAALADLAARGVTISARSRWYKTAPVPISDQPWFVNAVVAVETALTPTELLALLLTVEEEFGRVRSARNAPRILDLDVLAYGRVQKAGDLTLPHPRLHERAFVLLPIRDIAPDWRHPATGAALADMIAALPEGQDIEIDPDADGYLGTEWRAA